MKYSKAVIGLGFGDEGKGLVTDYLASSATDALVIRFSGGHQAGHTVVTNKIRHVFSNFGSGTLRGLPTYWSKFCTVEPIGLINELDVLLSKGVTPELFIDERCPITTPYDINHNRQLEGQKNHGSCGVGFGATLEREENLYSLTFGDLFYPKILEEKLKGIKDYYWKKITLFGDGVQLKNWGAIDLTAFLECCNIVKTSKHIKKIYGLPEHHSQECGGEYIFEGSQGLLLDQHFGFFPNVTRSNTGCKNIVEILGNTNFELYLVTRAYQTRHGNGPMTNESIKHSIKENPLETNKDHKYQGKFRRSILDLSLLEYALNKDEYIKFLDKDRYTSRKNLVITCLDHIDFRKIAGGDYTFTYNGELYCCWDEKEFIDKISKILKIQNVYISRSDNSNNIKKVKWQEK